MRKKIYIIGTGAKKIKTNHDCMIHGKENNFRKKTSSSYFIIIFIFECFVFLD